MSRPNNDNNKLRVMWVTSKTLSKQASAKIEALVKQGATLSEAIRQTMS